MHRPKLNNGTMKQLNKISNKGFTLIELMVVVAVIGIAVAVTIPAIIQMLPSMRLRAAASDLHGAFMQTKGMAVKRNVNCALTFNQLVGATTYAYIAYEDADADCEYDAGETIFVQLEQWPRDVQLNPDVDDNGVPDALDGNGLPDPALSFADNGDGNPTIAFRPTAIPTACGPLPNGTAYLFAPKTNSKRSIVVNIAGNISID